MDNEKREQSTLDQSVDAPSGRPRRQGRRSSWALLAGLLLGGGLGWMLAMYSGPMQEYRQLRAERADIQLQLEETRLRHQQLEVDLLVARQTLADNRTVVDDLEQQLFRLQQDLAQYQGALVPTAMAHGVRIQAFELQRTDVPGIFRYKVMVSRVGNENDTVEASLQVVLQGTEEGRTVQYSLEELSTEQTKFLPLNFRYFQVVPSSDGAELMLPLGFEPQHIQLKVEHDGKMLLEQTLEWVETGARS